MFISQKDKESAKRIKLFLVTKNTTKSINYILIYRARLVIRIHSKLINVEISGNINIHNSTLY